MQVVETGVVPREVDAELLGLIDIVLVVANAARFWVADPAAMAPMLRLPLALLPSFLVPIVFVTHALLFNRLSSRRIASR